MTIAELPAQPMTPAAAEQPPLGPIVLKGISWAAYESLVADLERSGQHIYLTYDQGNLEIMPPSPFHERYKTVIGRLIETMSMEMGIPIAGLGSTTFKREDLARGLEPDECYYVQRVKEMRGKFEIDLLRDPPPDLAIEMDHTHHAKKRDGIYAALGVPEFWQYDGERLRAFRRDETGQYQPIEFSVAFPFLRVAELERFLRVARETDDYEAAVALRDWLRQTHGRKG